MASGVLGKFDLTAAAVHLLFTAAVTPQTFNVRFCNRNNVAVAIRLAIGTGGAPAAEDYLDYDVIIPPNSILEDTGIVASSGENVWAYSNTSNVSVRAHGM